MKTLKSYIAACLILINFSFLKAGEYYPLHKAAYYGNVNWLKRLIQLNRDINERNEFGIDPAYI